MALVGQFARLLPSEALVVPGRHATVANVLELASVKLDVEVLRAACRLWARPRLSQSIDPAERATRPNYLDVVSEERELCLEIASRTGLAVAALGVRSVTRKSQEHDAPLERTA